MADFIHSPLPTGSSESWQRGNPARYFLGLHRHERRQQMDGAVVRSLGRGLASTVEVVRTASCPLGGPGTDGAEVQTLSSDDLGSLWSETAARLVTVLTERLSADDGVQLAIGLSNFGHWCEGGLQRRYRSLADPTLLAQLSGLTVVDDFPSRDLVSGGRGGPCEAAGLWILLASRGLLPGRQIRLLLDVDDDVRLVLLPPHQTKQLPSHLIGGHAAPGLKLVHEFTQDVTLEDGRGKLAAQGCCQGQLLAGWLQAAAEQQMT